MTLSDVNANYEDVFQLNFPRLNSNEIVELVEHHPSWTQYNPRKPEIRREGLSLTSLDGGMSGVPDLDSLLQYGKETGKKFSEEDFNVKTSVVEELPEIEGLIDYFEEDTGRTHFIRMASGGYFPPHRDNGFVVPPTSFRITVPLVDITPNGPFVWLIDGKPQTLLSGQTYYVNTTKSHSLFSMYDSFYLMVMNVVCSNKSLTKLIRRSKIV